MSGNSIAIEALVETPTMTRVAAERLIGCDSANGRIIGVDNRPPKRKDGVWLVTRRIGEMPDFYLVGAG